MAVIGLSDVITFIKSNERHSNSEIPSFFVMINNRSCEFAFGYFLNQLTIAICQCRFNVTF